MKLKDPEFRLSLGAIGFIVGIIIYAVSGIDNYNPDATIGVAMIGFSSSLLAAGLWKKGTIK
jgi:hypothetical protein